ncbi:FAD binding domain-containing protein [Alicyclobacillus mengziensis]|uniref:FAD binding domain-containing protein n=1 Tax=Alicyclobacillus mengziensis TaxID=2931921 RepID=A0A9X7VWC3_9BACL|nr:FAD binding domain-containing protein [Alicyclobacillus mengziensis]QSO46281.1 FAD binding domain-containing protein [Alicyclobacillus mengziensis]
MLPIDFDYVATKSLQDTVFHYTKAIEANLAPIYYAGGTEIITFARLGLVHPDVVIDTKGILQTRVLQISESRHSLVTGANIPLTTLTDDPLLEREFPLLQRTVAEIADRTARNKITLGGNICGQIFYREAVLPFLVCDSLVRLVGPSGSRELPMMQAFRKKLQLSSGEFLVQIATDERACHAPFVHIKRRKIGEVGYPIVTVAAIRWRGQIRVAFSGVTDFPFRSLAIEEALNRDNASREARVENALQRIPQGEILDDYEASREYRLFVLRDLLLKVLLELGR